MKNQKELILFNDDEHSYDYVRACLIKYCNHTYEQAEQCIIIANNAGKVKVKSSEDFLKLIEIQSNLENRNLKTEII